MFRTVAHVSGPWPPPTPQRQPAPPPPTLPPVAPRIEPEAPTPALAPMLVETIGGAELTGVVEDVAAARRRPVRWAVVGAISLVAALVCALVVVLGQPASEPGADDEEPGEFSLAAAMEQMSDAPTIEFRAEAFVDERLLMRMDVGIDSVERVATFAVSHGMGELDPVEVTPQQFTMIVDDRGGIAYASADAYGVGTIAADWVSWTEQDTGENWNDLFLGADLDPRTSLEALGDAAEFEVLGVETILTPDSGAIEARHVVVTVNVREAVAAERDQLLEAGGDVGELDDLIEEIYGDATMDYHLWVGPDDDIRRMTFEMDLDGELFLTTFDVITSDRRLDVQVPPDGVIVAASDLDAD